MVIRYESFWERQITIPALTGHPILRFVRRCSSYSQTLHDGMCNCVTTIPDVKEWPVARSQLGQVDDVARFCNDLKLIYLFFKYLVRSQDVPLRDNNSLGYCYRSSFPMLVDWVIIGLGNVLSPIRVQVASWNSVDV